MLPKPPFPVLQLDNPYAQGLTLGLPLYEGSGPTANDLSGNGNNGTLGGGATWGSGSTGVAVSCSGGGNISIAIPAIGANQSVSLVLNHRPTTWPGGFTALFDDAARLWSLFIDTSGNISFNGSLWVVTGSTAMTAGNYWQLVLVRDRTSGVESHYVNGKFINSGTSSNSAIAATTVSFGSNPSGGGSNANTLFDNIALYPYALTAAQVAALYADSFQMYRQDQGWWMKSSGATSYFLSAGAGSFALTGEAATLAAARLLSAGEGVFALTGKAATLKAARLLTAGEGAFTVFGEAATLDHGFTVVAGEGSFALTGEAAGLVASRVIAAAEGVFSVTGEVATLTHSGGHGSVIGSSVVNSRLIISAGFRGGVG